jgi:hypothetical protein
LGVRVGSLSIVGERILSDVHLEPARDRLDRISNPLAPPKLLGYRLNDGVSV